MKKQGKRSIAAGVALVIIFAVFTWLVQTVDVQPLGVNGTNIGFAALNTAFHKLCGVHMALYTITDWLGLVPFFVAAVFGTVGLIQLIRRRSLRKVDADILVLGVHYLVVIALYLAFEMIPINYRPILIEGAMEVSYPSSTTLLVLGIMPTLWEQVDRRWKAGMAKTVTQALTLVFSGFMVIGRLISGVHWLSDIIGGALLSTGLVVLYGWINSYIRHRTAQKV